MIDVLSKLLDFLFSRFIERKKEKDLLYKKFEVLKRKIKYVLITNNLPLELNKLRLYIIEGNLMDQPEIKEFYEKWLTDPVVTSGIAASNVFSEEEIEALQAELDQLHL